MKITWQAVVIDVILYGLIVLYEFKIDQGVLYIGDPVLPHQKSHEDAGRRMARQPT